MLDATWGCTRVSVRQGHFNGCLRLCFSSYWSSIWNIRKLQQWKWHYCECCHLCYLIFFTALTITAPVHSRTHHTSFCPVRSLLVKYLVLSCRLSTPTCKPPLIVFLFPNPSFDKEATITWTGESAVPIVVDRLLWFVVQGPGSPYHSPVGRGSPLMSPFVGDPAAIQALNLDPSCPQVPEDVYRLAISAFLLLCAYFTP